MKKIYSFVLVFIVMICSIFTMFGCNSESKKYKDSEIKEYLTVYGSCVKSGITFTPYTTTYNSEAKITISIEPTHSNIVYKNVSVKMKVLYYVPVYMYDTTKPVSERETRVGGLFDLHETTVSIRLDSAGKGSATKNVDPYSCYPEISTSVENTLWFKFSSTKATLTYEILSIVGECYFV